MTEPAKQTVHESEAQRQYVRIAMPARVEINGQNYTVKDLSSGGLGLTGVEDEFKKGEVIHLTLVFPFPEFSLDTHLEVQVQSYNKKEQLLGARFVNLTSSQISMISHVIRSFISGDVVAAKDVLEVAQRSDFVRVRKQNADQAGSDNNVSLVKNIVPLLLIAMLGLLALFLIASNMYRGYFVFSANTGVVRAQTMELRIPTGGVFDAIIEDDVFQVKQGDELAKISSSNLGSGSSLNFVLKSPCDCFITQRYARNGEYLNQGMSVFELTDVGEQPFVEVLLTPDVATNVRLKDKAIMRVTGTDVEVSGQVSDIEFYEADMASPVMTKITMQPDQKLPIDFVGRPVTAEFKKF